MPLHAFIRSHLHEILARWRSGAVTDVADNGHEALSSEDAEALLLALARDLEAGRSDPPGTAPPEDADGSTCDAVRSRVARQHAGVSLDTLLHATGALRTAVLRHWLPGVDMRDTATMDEMTRFNGLIDRALSTVADARETRAREDRVRLENRLQESEERYRGIVTTALDYAIFSTDADGIIRSWPSGAHAVFGWSAEETIGQHAAMTFTPEDRAADVPGEEMRGAREHGVAPDVRWHACKGGDRVFIEGAMRPILGASGEIAGYLKVGRDATERRQWDERQQALLKELQHRTRNIMAVVLAVFDKTRLGSPDVDTLATNYRRQLGALVRVQELLSHLQEGDRVDFDVLLRTELSAMGALDEDGHGRRVALSGPTGVRLRSRSVQTLALALHELATNASKYGALAQPQGHLAVAWRVDREDDAPWLHLEWLESHVDMARAADMPRGGGAGRELIEYALPYQLGARTTYAIGVDGVRCTIAMPISETPSPQPPQR